MATVTLKYNARNKYAKNVLQLIYATGLFNPVAEPVSKLTGLEEAMQDVKCGRVYSAKDAKSLINDCLK
ncbi:MAG: hypothetical protein LBB53_01105 [Prevotellaceae bacterium]|jgi:hypothetical protein|nr:hypothetical protein [Prevotellaceae bacterium]